MEIYLTRSPIGALVPINEDEAEKIKAFKPGAAVRATVVRQRNIKFFRKFWVLIGMLYDIWQETMPETEYRGTAVRANKDRFRRDLVIMTGRFDATYNIRGEVRLEAKSISFTNMEESEFERLYSEIIDVALTKVLNRPDLTEASIREHCERILRFS